MDLAEHYKATWQELDADLAVVESSIRNARENARKMTRFCDRVAELNKAYLTVRAMVTK